MGNLRSKAFAIASVLVPLIVLAAWAISVEIKSDGGAVRRVKIVGYDPVDMLSGHYLVYRYDFGKLDICKDVPNHMNVCICVGHGFNKDNEIIATKKIECDVAGKTCDLHIKGRCDYSTFLTSSERFYFPESYSAVLARVPENAQAEISIQKNGAINLRNIYVWDQPLLDWAHERLNSDAIKP